jgi:hypothetical protein
MLLLHADGGGGSIPDVARTVSYFFLRQIPSIAILEEGNCRLKLAEQIV